MQCVEKGLNCSAAPTRSAPYRSGRLIEQARGAFGSAASRQSSDPDDEQGQLEVIAGSTWLESEQSVGRRLGTQEIQAAVTASLLDSEPGPAQPPPRTSTIS